MLYRAAGLTNLCQHCFVTIMSECGLNIGLPVPLPPVLPLGT
jgi:hypothetical protein